MLSKDDHGARPLLLALALGLCCSAAARAQGSPPPPAPGPEEEVVRITTELVQTDVAVFDKRGRFVEDLRPEQFELQVNGRAQAIAFFERVREGGRVAQAPAPATEAIGPVAAGAAAPRRAAAAETAGRLIFFFVDDLHLSSSSVGRARTALQRYVEQSMNPGDQVAIVSASGQVGFLQQLTDDRAVLRAAIGRLGYEQKGEVYTGNTHISEHAASQVLDSGNRELYAYLLESTKIEQQMGPGSRHGDHGLAASYSAAPHLRNRLRQVRAMGRMATTGTLRVLRSLLLSTGELPGRKLVFFLSDGFILNERDAGAAEMLGGVAQTAAQAGAVVYTMDLRESLFAPGSGVDASTNHYVDFTARRVGADFGEVAATREPLQLLADQTGGRAFFNYKSVEDAVRQALDETADYYLLAWRPDAAELRESGARLKVSVRGHPEWRVRLRNAKFSPLAARVNPPTQPARTSPAPRAAAAGSDDDAVGPAGESHDARGVTAKAVAAKSEDAAKADDAALLAALGALYPRRGLPVAVSAGYLDAGAEGLVLNVSMQLARTAFDFDAAGGRPRALVDVAGAAIDDRGQFGSFKQLLTITPDAAAGGGAPQPVVWHQRLRLKPGLYQVRVALRDRATGRVGSAAQWVEVPDLSKGELALSSILLGERGPAESEAGRPRAVAVEVDRRFARTSVLRFQTYVYNAARDGRVRLRAEVLRGTTPLITTEQFDVPAAADPARLPFWSELSLAQLPPGHYVLQLTATDGAPHRTAVARVGFYVE